MATSAGPVTRTASFGSLEIHFDARVLEPRPWTTAQSEWAAELLSDAPAGPVLELCAGAGQIGLLAVALAPRPLVCVDANPVACAYLCANADRAGLAEVTVREGLIDEVLEAGERFALVIADPPWVRSPEIGRFPDDPQLAIDGGDDGLHVARVCVRAIERHLLPGGSAVLQLGTAAQARVLAAETPLVLVEVREFPRGVLVRLDAPE